MITRAMWKGVLSIDGTRVPVKLYSAVEDHDIRFRLLDKKNLLPVTQALVHPDTGDVVPHEQTQRGYMADDALVILRPEELAALAPKESRDIEVARFVPVGAIDAQWYDRPYYLGPYGDTAAYAALIAALERTACEGIARWTMRKKAYVGALRVREGNLVLVTLRHVGEVVSIESLGVDAGPSLDAKELEMARQLIEMLEADFDPDAFRDDYRDKLLALIESKGKGKKPKLELVRPKARTDDLSAALKASLRAGTKREREKKRATA